MMQSLFRFRRALRAGRTTFQASWRPERYSARFTEPLSTEMREATRAIRGEHPAAILVHGVLPRSGSVYCGRLLRNHPDVYAYPNELWELPLLHALPAVEDLQRTFINGYGNNARRLGPHDFLGLVGSAFIGYLYAQVPAGKRLLMKVPLASHLAQFDLMFPHEQCVMLMRDGRDLTASTLRSWPQRRFADVAAEWNHAASYMLDQPWPMYRYEDIVADPEGRVRELCIRVGLDPDRYPYDTIAAQPLKGSSEFVKEKGWEAVAAPAGFRSTGRWAEWDTARKRDFKKIAGETLIRAGYESDHAW